MLHGHAKIELKNVKTGVTQVVEHDNMLTNYWRDMLKPRTLHGRSFVATLGEQWKKDKLFGGVILLADSVDEDADNYAFPHDNRMTARGSNIAYSGLDTTLGSFNEAVSEIGTDSATFVWDWSQERGNGTISALGLTSYLGGLIGAGRNIEGDNANDMVVELNNKLYDESGSVVDNYAIVFVDIENNKMYGVAWNSNVLTVREYQYPYTSVDLLTFVLEGQNGDHRYLNTSAYVSHTVDLSAYSLGTYPVATVNDGKLYITQETDSWASGAKTFVVYDFATKAVSTINVTNNTGERFYMYSYGIQRTGAYAVHEGYLYAVTQEMHVAYINLSDNTDCGVVNDGSGTPIVRTSNGYYNFAQIWGELIFNKSTIHANGKGDDNHKTIYVLDSKSVARRRNLAPFNLSYYGYYTMVDGGDNAYGFYYNQDTHRLVISYNLMCLATKNNLDSAVTKTADMTMRVTYTIQEEE